jgi:hypothetical protein
MEFSKPIVDLYAPTAPGSMMRSIIVNRKGLWRIARQAAEIYSVQIISSGTWGRARVMDGDGRPIWYQISTFTGSFWLAAGTYTGVLVELDSAEAAAPNLTINFRLQTLEMV